MRNLLRFAVLATVAVLAEAGAARPADSRFLRWYDRPAQYWEEALPVGNGRIGVMVFGGVHREHIPLNEETIWSGTPTPKLAEPAFREKLRRQRELISAWKPGSVSGLRARGGFLVGLKWQGGALANTAVQPQHCGSCTVHARTPFHVGSEHSRAVGPEHTLTFSTTAGQLCRITAVR